MSEVNFPPKVFILRNEDIRNNCLLYINEAPLEPLYKVEIKLHKESRSLAQNRLVHKWFSDVAKEIGCSPRGVKHSMKSGYGLVDFYTDINGEIIEELRSTANYSVQEMADFITFIEVWAVENGYILDKSELYKEAKCE